MFLIINSCSFMYNINIKNINNNKIKIQQEIRQDLINNGLGEYSNLVNNFVELLSEALEKKQAEVNYWKTKAYILFQNSNIGRLECPEHDTHIERSFDIWEAINKRNCKNCLAMKSKKSFYWNNTI